MSEATPTISGASSAPATASPVARATPLLRTLILSIIGHPPAAAPESTRDLIRRIEGSTERKSPHGGVEIWTPAPTERTLRRFGAAILARPADAELRAAYALALSARRRRRDAVEQYRKAI